MRADSKGLPLGDHRIVLFIATLAFSDFTGGFLLGAVPSVTPAVGRLLHVSAADLNWSSAAHLLAAGVLVPIFARLGDMYGHRLFLRVSIAASLTGAALCAAAPNFGVFLLGRILEGAVAAITPLAAGIIRDRLEGQRMRRAVSSLFVGLTGGSAIGLLVSAEIFDASASARAVLWMPVIGFALAFLLVLLTVPETVARARVRPDWVGYLTLGVGLAVLLLGTAKGNTWGWTNGTTLGCLIGGAAVLAVWTRTELSVTDPMVDVRAATRRQVAPFYIAAFTFGCAYFGAQTATTLFMDASADNVGYGFGLQPTGLALALLPTAVFGMVGAMSVAPLAARISHQQLLYVGCTAVAAGYLLMALLHGELAEFIVGGCVCQYGLGLSFGSLTLVMAERSERTGTGIATGLVSTMRNVGGSAAGAVFSAVLSAVTLAHTEVPSETAFVAVWLSCGAGAVITGLVVAAAGGLGQPRRETPVSQQAAAGGGTPTGVA
ncbi:MFS transporter [Streptomyces sp. NPDC047081]|uniref:MFS transporter n=1 Tax=Streptomyces sp. NPDC047081 TaxID=3154706 RepID=UPI0033E73309